MKQLLSKLWHDPVWSKVIAGTLLAIGSIVVVYFLNLISAVRLVFAIGIAYLLATTAVPNYLLIVAGLFSVPTIIIIGFIIRLKLFPPKPKSAIGTWRDKYTSDLFFGLRWRWKYASGDDAKIFEVTTFCPRCDYQIYHKRTSIFDSPIAFYCECCNLPLASMNETYLVLEDKTIRHIHKKIRNETWGTQNSV